MIDEWDIAVRVIGAAAMGALVGYDRQLADKPAGVRTHMLVAAGAALFVGLGVLLGEGVEELGTESASIDISRIIAGVVTGVGFLGAGAIIRRGDGVSGLPTAAGIWVVAGIGSVVAFGFWSLGLVVTLLVVAIHAISYLEERLRIRSAGTDEPVTD